jgi:hypothetical protein
MEVTSDLILGISLGILVDKLADIVAKYFGLGNIARLFIQLFFIIVVLYMMKLNAMHMYASWHTEQGYGIVFIALFLASQKNLLLILANAYSEE